jgi:hypothetical protein
MVVGRTKIEKLKNISAQVIQVGRGLIMAERNADGIQDYENKDEQGEAGDRSPIDNRPGFFEGGLEPLREWGPIHFWPWLKDCRSEGKI